MIEPDPINNECKYIEHYNSEIRVRMIYETQAEMRLKKLLYKHKFEEAEQFVDVYNLDKNSVLKARAQVLVDKSYCSENEVDDLIKILKTIDDDLFKMICIENTTCRSISGLKKLLDFGSFVSQKSVRNYNIP